jgi:crotonobetainyl-CoA:carnitine CoA-transferase CaiB-like acyl-CoA transferase
MPVLDGIKVIEVASWVFAPSSGVVLAQWGADVVKVEDPASGDPTRGLVHSGGPGQNSGGVRLMYEIANLGKRSIGLNLKSPEGIGVLYRLVETADVFVTNYLPRTRASLRIDVEDIRRVNPRIIYCRGSGTGSQGPERERPGFDSTSYWARAGIQSVLSAGVSEWPLIQRGAFGDIMAGLTLAGSISAALYQRERTGQPSVVDVSLLATGLWNLTPDIVLADLLGPGYNAARTRDTIPNPLVCTYRTSDGQWLVLNMLDSDRTWGEFCRAIERPDLFEDPRFAHSSVRGVNSQALIAELDAVFAAQSFPAWRERLSATSIAWAPVQSPSDVHHDQQVAANGYIARVETGDGQTIGVPTNPVRFDEQAVTPGRSPEHGEHTEQILIEAGYDWDAITELKANKAVM